jgi:Ca2+-binding RTX toxin-like protein
MMPCFKTSTSMLSTLSAPSASGRPIGRWRRWAIGLSTSLLLLACGGPAALDLGSDDSALETPGNDSDAAGSGTLDATPDSMEPSTGDNSSESNAPYTPEAFRLRCLELGLPIIEARPGVPTSGTSAPECIIGTDDDDVINAGDGGDLVLGLGGNDTLRGEQGDDLLYGGDGDDLLEGGDGSDLLEGDDRAIGENGQDLPGGSAGNDTLEGGGGADVLNGGAGDDAITGGDGDDVLDGGQPGDNDSLDGGPGANVCLPASGIPAC